MARPAADGIAPEAAGSKTFDPPMRGGIVKLQRRPLSRPAPFEGGTETERESFRLQTVGVSSRRIDEVLGVPKIWVRQICGITENFYIILECQELDGITINKSLISFIKISNELCSSVLHVDADLPIPRCMKPLWVLNMMGAQ
ncbi:MAG: hypothetical protein LBR80_16735 [Deltaproteobacteria bacterium]|jgi:hypothetical protein|nr:hypothetical protein [Deltaproteobacteria bacterium]